jgi:hypothetical protein
LRFVAFENHLILDAVERNHGAFNEIRERVGGKIADWVELAGF